MAGKDVDDRIISQGIRDEHKIWKIIISMVNALEVCHELDIVHRDLKVAFTKFSHKTYWFQVLMNLQHIN